VHGALTSAKTKAADIDVVVADAAGVAELDAVEAATIAEVFGPHGVPVTVPKVLTGRLYSGGGPLDVVNALLMIRDGVIPAAPEQLDVAAEHAIDVVVGGPRECRVRNVLVISRGNGGFNSAVVVRAV
jgi:act minimal PKS chain-length factor (CLF/KS beta)